MKMLDHLNVLEYELKKHFLQILTDQCITNIYNVSLCFFCYFQKQTCDAIIKVIILCPKQQNQKPVVKPIDYIKEQINNIF